MQLNNEDEPAGGAKRASMRRDEVCSDSDFIIR